MTRILALDTSTDACSVALLVDGEVQEDFRIAPRRHTHLLLPMVEAIMSDAGLSFGQLDAIAFGRGPGSFAGIRIATGAAQGLALAVDIPLIPVSTLQAMAVDAASRVADSRSTDIRTTEKVFVAALDARMNEIYWSALQVDDDYAVTERLPEQVSSPQALILPADMTSWVAIGSGWRYLDQMTPDIRDQVNNPDLDLYPRAGAMLKLAERAFANGQLIQADDATPVYLRDEVAWKKKDQQ
ncbi:tRNA (adenosine(37)-N6)-threonylcarbamoyltransferase complex dimerization subunit type 1 TsaB [Nitrincola sp. MINF-07-Sa-05]|uniref:tRNA (adenosine(37)-N6)-threonylcarbamoyltransferase complex dimerization subunit type 1 TsaB n=1 Tax=Nitrincola salilacus TaxID=3400273 RepID=UPI0039181459